MHYGANGILFVTKILMRLDIWFHHKMQMSQQFLMEEINAMHSIYSTILKQYSNMEQNSHRECRNFFIFIQMLIE